MPANTQEVSQYKDDKVCCFSTIYSMGAAINLAGLARGIRDFLRQLLDGRTYIPAVATRTEHNDLNSLHDASILRTFDPPLVCSAPLKPDTILESQRSIQCSMFTKPTTRMNSHDYYAPLQRSPTCELCSAVKLSETPDLKLQALSDMNLKLVQSCLRSRHRLVQRVGPLFS